MRRVRIGNRVTGLALGLALTAAAGAGAAGASGAPHLTLLHTSGGPTSQIAVGFVAPGRTFERGQGGAFYFLRIQGPGSCDADGVANFAKPAVEAGDDVVILATPDDLDKSRTTWCAGSYLGTVSYETINAAGHRTSTHRLGQVRWTIRSP